MACVHTCMACMHMECTVLLKSADQKVVGLNLTKDV